MFSNGQMHSLFYNFITEFRRTHKLESSKMCQNVVRNHSLVVKDVIGLSKGLQNVVRGELLDHFCLMGNFYLKVVRTK